MRILITEDDAALAEALQFSLKQAGYAVDWVGNGSAADEALKEDVFGLLILDLGLPKLDGFEVLRRLRRRNPALPVLILGGFTSIPGAIVGGLIVGAGEKLAEVLLAPVLTRTFDLAGGGIENWFAYVLALVFLLFRPQGLFGERIIERV